MSRLVIKFPTRNRPEKFKAVFEQYISHLSGNNDVQFIISMDNDDLSMNNHEIHEWLDTLAKTNSIKWFYGNSKTKIEACNANLDGIDGDVLLLASDDMIPQQMGFDEIIFESFRQCFPDFSGAIKFWDGLRPKTDALMTLTVMGFPLYKKFGYIYHPEYKSLYCDNEQTQVCYSLGKLAISDTCIIQHQWTHEPFDELHARNENREMYDVDRITFEKRAAINFDLGAVS